jgi:hypothetical protein
MLEIEYSCWWYTSTRTQRTVVRWEMEHNLYCLWMISVHEHLYMKMALSTLRIFPFIEERSRENRAGARVASNAGERAAGASLIPRNRNLRLSPGLAPNNFCYLSRVELQREYDVSVVYGAMDGPDDLTKDTMWFVCSCRFVRVRVVWVWCACVALVWVCTWADTMVVPRRETSKKSRTWLLQFYYFISTLLILNWPSFNVIVSH